VSERAIENSEPERRAVEAWARAKGTPAWLFAAARACNRWPIGIELTADEFDAAVAAAASTRIS
jgi:hypothetical protein